jgi:type II secretory pathway pseudopilin PulG
MRRACRRRKCAGFSQIELAVVIIVFSVLTGSLLERLHHYEALAEKAAFESTLRLVKTGLQIRLAELIITNREGEARTLEQEDPTTWLSEKPATFAGDYREPPERGTWYFDSGSRQLIYVVNNGQSLVARESAGMQQLRFQTKLIVAPFGPQSVAKVVGVTLVPVYPYTWS